MRWKRLGKIFDPAEQGLPTGCFGFAQSPQAVVFNDFVRVYFSTRTRDARSDKYLSHVAFADFSFDFREILRVSRHQVIPLGALGTFDEHGIFPFHPIRRGDQIFAYTTGWSRRVSVSVETGIGLVVSNDEGETFARQGDGPVVSSSLHEPCLVGDAYVREYGDTLHMWYIFGTGWQRFSSNSAPDRTYKIGHATSQNGVDWHKEEARQIIPDRLGPEESQALPTVVDINGRFLLAFCYRQSFDFRVNTARSYRIGYAWSEDLKHWSRDDDSLPFATAPAEWEANMQCYPNLVQVRGETFMLYNGTEFGRHGFGAAILVQ